MKLRLSLFLFLACTLLAGSAMAQGCSTNPIPFPLPGGSDKTVGLGTCIANLDDDGHGPVQGGRLRWANNGGHELQLFDADDAGQLLWCANNSGVCAVGAILCLQQDGNMVIYASNATQPAPQCVNNGDGGSAVWSSNTQFKNDGQEELAVDENVDYLGVVRKGDRAVVRNSHGVQWASIGYND